GIPRAVDPEPVPLAGVDAADVAVVGERGDVGQLDAGLAAVVVEQAQLDCLGDLREVRAVGARSVVGGAEGCGPSGPGLHGGEPTGAPGRRWAACGAGRRR